MKKYGYKPSTKEHLAKLNRLSHMGLELKPGSVSLAEYLPKIVLDQNMTSGCMGHGESVQVYAELKAAGNPIDFIPSPDGIYKLARAIERAAKGLTPDYPLEDDGTYPEYVMAALENWGIVPMKDVGFPYSDCVPATVNQEPDFEDLEKGRTQLVIGQYSIQETGQALASLVQLALQNKHMVTFGVRVDGAFEEWKPSDGIIKAPDPHDIRGGHWLCAYAMDVASDLKDIKLYFRNSWSISWGDEGNGVANLDFMNEWMEARVLTCTKLTPANGIGKRVVQ